MELVLSALCDDARIRADGRLDLSGVFSQLQAPGFPAAQERMTAVFVIEWDGEDAGHQALRADLVDASGNKVLTIEGHTQVGPASAGAAAPQTRLIMPLEKVVFPHEGTYHFELVAGGDARRACSVHVAKARSRSASTG